MSFNNLDDTKIARDRGSSFLDLLPRMRMREERERGELSGVRLSQPQRAAPRQTMMRKCDYNLEKIAREFSLLAQ